MSLHHLADDRLDLVRQRAAIGVAQHDPARAFLVSRLGAGQRVRRIGLVAVEEMLAVEQHLPALRLGRAHAVADRGDVFLFRRLQRDAHMIVPRLGDEADGVGLRLEQRGQPRIVRGRAARPPRHAEGGEGRAELALGREQLGVGRIGAGIAALDIVDAELVEHARDGELVGEREVDAVGLRAVAQRGVEQIETFAGHDDITRDNGSPPGDGNEDRYDRDDDVMTLHDTIPLDDIAGRRPPHHKPKYLGASATAAAMIATLSTM